uniref:GGDEF domain-containing protein n=1 Tax=Acetatifactor sp. TaxID=1872090 RepID=UPI004056B9F1
MQNILYKTYHVFWTIFIVLFLLLFAFFELDIYDEDVKDGYEIVSEYDVYDFKDDSEPAGARRIYGFRLTGIEESYCHLMFYTIHQNVNVYLNDVCIYRMSADEMEISGESPGCLWNEVSFAAWDNGQRLKIEIIPVYESSVDIVPTFYLGSKADITNRVIMKELPVIILSMVTVAFGIIYVAFILYNYKKTDLERNLLMLGYFAIQVGLWKATDSQAVTLLLPEHPVISQVPFMALMLMSVSFTLFVKELYHTRDHVIWKVMCIYGFVNMGITILLQYLGFADMREALTLTHINILLVIVVSTIMSFYEVKNYGWNKKLKKNILFMGICFMGCGADMVMHYITSGQAATMLGMLSFMAYIFVMGFDSMQEIKNLMDIGIKAQQYEKMAYHDQLTGLFNRTAFAEHTNDVEFVAEKTIIVVMDLNNLKTCNDKLGHDKGDIYIKECARMIHESFEDIGRCYRMGGDEFHVLLTNGDLHLCKQRLQVLKERVAKCDKVEGFRMGIACGYKMYDRLLDYDIHETARRADKVMYQEKFAMKEL